MNAIASRQCPKVAITTPRGNFTFPSRSTIGARSTSTTSQRASLSLTAIDQSPWPHSHPCRPAPHSFVGCQSGATTGPDSGHLKPPCDVMSALQVRSTSTFSGAAGAAGCVLRLRLEPFALLLT